MFGPIGLAFKALSWKVKLGIAAGLLVLLTITHGSAYLIGLNKGKAISATAIAQYETKIAHLQGEINKGQGNINGSVQIKYVDRTNTIHEIEYRNRDVIKNNVTNRDETVSCGWIYAHNQSALGKPIDPALAADSKPCNVNDVAVLTTVAANYNAAHLKDAKIEGLQEWITRTKQMYDDFATKGKSPEVEGSK
jgi:hypothetical protein